MLFLKQSTAVTVNFGPLSDKTDGVTNEIALATAMDHATTGIRISKNGGTYAARNTATATTYDAFGEYKVSLNATDTNTLGILKVIFNDAATFVPIWQEFMIMVPQLWDSYFGTGGAIPGLVAGAAGGLVIAGTNAPITLTGAGLTATLTGNLTGTLSATERNAIADALLVRVMTESYSASGAAPTVAQALFELLSERFEKSLAGTVYTWKKRDHSTTAMTGATNSAVTPTSVTRST